MIRLANRNDIDPIMGIVRQAQSRLAAAGVDQWQDGYPNPAIFENDISKGNCYVFEDNESIVGFAVIIFDVEPTYAKIEGGQWLTDNCDYCVIHRIAVDNSFLKAGIGSEFFRYAEQLCHKKNVKVMRIDTHKDNIPMNSLIKKMGYTYCGIITLLSGSLRNAYEKIL